MSSVLYRIGRFCARRVRLVIGVWLVAAVAVAIAAGTVGGELEDTFEVPGLDSQVAVELLSDAESERAGLTARLVATPTDDAETFFDSPAARDELTRAQRAIEALPTVLATSDPAGALAAGPEQAVSSGAASADGRIAMMTIQYPVIEDLSRDDLDQLKDAVGELEG